MEKSVSDEVESDDFGSPYRDAFEEEEEEDWDDDEEPAPRRATRDEYGLHTFLDVYDESHRVSRIVNLDGSLVVEDVAFNQLNFLQPDCFDRDNAEEEYSGYTGNEVRSGSCN